MQGEICHNSKSLLQLNARLCLCVWHSHQVCCDKQEKANGLIWSLVNCSRKHPWSFWNWHKFAPKSCVQNVFWCKVEYFYGNCRIHCDLDVLVLPLAASSPKSKLWWQTICFVLCIALVLCGCYKRSSLQPIHSFLVFEYSILLLTFYAVA